MRWGAPCATCACRSPTAATCAAPTACRRRSTGGCRRARSSPSRSSARWWIVFLALGVDKVRLTGGEPLLRRDLPELVRLLAAKPALRDLALTTNGVLLAEQAEALKDAGLQRRHGEPRHPEARAVSAARPARRHARGARGHRGRARGAASAGPQARHGRDARRERRRARRTCSTSARHVGAEVRFIEYMDVGGATRWSMDQVVSRAEMLERLAARHGPIEPLGGAAPRRPSASASATARSFGIIASTTAPFCAAATAAGSPPTAPGTLPLRRARAPICGRPLRDGATPGATGEPARRRRGARAPTAAPRSGSPCASRGAAARRPASCARDPHLEMHTRGG